MAGKNFRTFDQHFRRGLTATEAASQAAWASANSNIETFSSANPPHCGKDAALRCYETPYCCAGRSCDDARAIS